MMNETLEAILKKHNVTAEDIADALYSWLAEYSEGKEGRELMKDLAEFIK